MTSTADASLQTEYSDFEFLEPELRHIFLGVFIVVTVLSLIANCSAICYILRKNYRFFQKTCIISLAVSDTLATIFTSIVNITTFVREVKDWPLPSFLCPLSPMMQLMSILASSAALTIIAMDRYRNVVFVLTTRWNPQFIHCLLGTLAVWLICFGVSYPLYTWFTIQYIIPSKDGLSMLPCCFMKITKDQKTSLRNYYIATVLVVFLPLLVVFVWFYYNVTALVWKHRKPFSNLFNKNSVLENSSSTTKSHHDMKNLNQPKTQEDIRVERKIRTCKIIIVLMVVFIICRLPFFVYQIFKTSASSETADPILSWILSFTFQALIIVNGILNPLLYTFLHQTLKAWSKLKSFVFEICCLFCSRKDFECFETEDNPFVFENPDSQRNSIVTIKDGKY